MSKVQRTITLGLYSTVLRSKQVKYCNDSEKFNSLVDEYTPVKIIPSDVVPKGVLKRNFWKNSVHQIKEVTKRNKQSLVVIYHVEGMKQAIIIWKTIT